MASPSMKKLRIRAGRRLPILNARSGSVKLLEDSSEYVGLMEAPKGGFDFVQLSVKDSTECTNRSSAAFDAVKYDGLQL